MFRLSPSRRSSRPCNQSEGPPRPPPPAALPPRRATNPPTVPSRMVLRGMVLRGRILRGMAMPAPVQPFAARLCRPPPAATTPPRQTSLLSSLFLPWFFALDLRDTSCRPQCWVGDVPDSIEGSSSKTKKHYERK